VVDDVSPVLIGGLLGAGVGIGVLVVAAAWRGDMSRLQPRRATGVDRLWLRSALATAGLLTGALLTGWVALAGALALAGWAMPSLVGLRSRRRRLMERTEAVATWAEMLRDLLTSSAGLQEAIGKSASVAPRAIHDEVEALYVRAQRGDLAAALRRFAADVADPVADTLVAALLIADARAGADLGGMLAAVAGSTRDAVATQQRIGAARARIYRTSQLIAGIVSFFVGVLVLTNRSYMEPFGTATGQLVLTVVFALLGAALWAMLALSAPPSAPRLLDLRAAARGAAR
jgi:tight adherence protein B